MAGVVGAIRRDSFDQFLLQTLKHYSVGPKCVFEHNHLRTTITYISIDEHRELDFEFMRGTDGNSTPE